ncbi:UNVERIFIED_CONTAM: hypothetical protein FKN15_061726 [Acipenser sinensis]
MAPHPQKFPDFVEEVHSSWDHPASGPSMLKQATPLSSLEGVEKLGLPGFPPVDPTIMALVKAPPGSQVTLLLCQKLLGLMTAAISAIQLGLLRMRPLQAWLNAFHLNPKCDRHRWLMVSLACSAALHWWRATSHLREGEKGEALEAGKGHYGPQSPDGPGPGAFGQTGTCSPGCSHSSVTAPTAIPPSPRGQQGGWEEASQLVQGDMLPIVASGDGASFSSDMQVPWTPAAEPRQSVFQTQAMAPHPQKFPDFVEEVHSSWDHPASGPSMLKQATPLSSLEGVEKLGLPGFPPVDPTIMALVKAPPVGGVARDLACPNTQKRTSSGSMHKRSRKLACQTRKAC